MSDVGSPSSSAARTAIACLLAAAIITALRFVVAEPVQAVGFLYVIPISIAAAALGWRPALALAGAAFAATVWWGLANDVSIDALGYSTRAVTFASVAVIVGLQHARRVSAERDRERLVAELRDLAMRDQLTGLPNRRAWEQRLDEELVRSARTRQPVTIAAIDLDRLKQVNDTLGHAAGDEFICASVRAWSEAIRGGDLLARLGGDEFFVVLPDCDLERAGEVTQRLVSELPDGHSCSIGIAQWDGVASATALMQRADSALYAAKRAGRGVVRSAALVT